MFSNVITWYWDNWNSAYEWRIHNIGYYKNFLYYKNHAFLYSFEVQTVANLLLSHVLHWNSMGSFRVTSSSLDLVCKREGCDIVTFAEPLSFLLTADHVSFMEVMLGTANDIRGFVFSRMRIALHPITAESMNIFCIYNEYYSEDL